MSQAKIQCSKFCGNYTKKERKNATMRKTVLKGNNDIKTVCIDTPRHQICLKGED